MIESSSEISPVRILAEFDAYLQLERGLSANTRTAYHDDAAKLVDFITTEHSRFHPGLISLIRSQRLLPGFMTLAFHRVHRPESYQA